MPEAEIRRSVGRLCAAFGALYLLPVLGLRVFPGAMAVSARAWSFLFFIHFLGLVAGGIGLQALAAARSRLFHGGPLIDFLIGVAGFMLLESFVGAALRGGSGPSWPALVPGAALLAFGLRLRGGRPLLGS